MMKPMHGEVPQDQEASWCQNCFGCTGTNVSFGHAFDVILLRRPDTHATTSSSSSHHTHGCPPPQHAASRLYFSFPFCQRDGQACLEVWDGATWLRFPIQKNTLQRQVMDKDDHDLLLANDNNNNNNGDTNNHSNTHNSPGSNSPTRNMKMERWSDEPDEEMTQLLPARRDDDKSHDDTNHDPVALAQLAQALVLGKKNPARFVWIHNHAVTSIAPCFVHYWSTHDRIVIMDIDGSITKSNVLGLVDTLVTEAYTHCHAGVCHFLTQLIHHGSPQVATSASLRILYLSSRPLGLANFTRKFLTNVMQSTPMENAMGGDAIATLPEGPLLGFSGTIPDILHMELIAHSVHTFKQEAIRQNVLAPWALLGETTLPFWAALGNTWMDVQAYQAVGIPLTRMGFITKKSIIHILRPPLPPLQRRHFFFPPATPPVPDAEHSFDSFGDPGLLEYFCREA